MNDLLALLTLEPWNRFTAGLIAAVGFARGMDFLSTWLVTPNLALEANPLLRQASWTRLALLNLPLLGLPLLHHGLAITLIVTSLLVAGTTLAQGALARGMGERRQLESQAQALRRLGLAGALALNSGGALLICLSGGFLMVLAGPAESPPWWGALGVVMYGVTGLIHLNLALLRLHRRARR